jgi:kumamolisin
VAKHAPVVGSRRVPLPGARVLGRTSARKKAEVSLKLRRKRKLPELTARPASVMTRDVLASRYGASKRDIAKVVAAFKKYGLKVVHTNPATRTIRLSGTIAQLEAAFHTRLFDYAYVGGQYRGRVGLVHVPVDVRSIVEAVFGLDDRPIARRRWQRLRAKSRPAKRSIPAPWYTPAELAKRYDFPDGDGADQTIALLEFGGGYFPNDLKKFCALVGVTKPTVTVVSVDGASTTRRDGSQSEVMLDVEVIAGICPKVSIVVYFAPWTEQGWITALDAAAQDRKNDPGVISISWGNAEDIEIWTRQAIAQINEILKEAAYLGITVCVAAGDDGSSDGVTDGHAHVDFPGSSPYVLSIGGTTIATKNADVPDVVWKEGDGLRAHDGGSTGGGVSAVLERPKWQSSIKIKSVNPGRILGRCVPDVAANADWNTSPYLLVADGLQQANGGTSAASPLCAALITLINAKRPAANPVGYLTPVLYQSLRGKNKKTVGATVCEDVTSGDNATDKLGGYDAKPGYDAASGWGVPNGKRLASALPFRS